MASFASPGQFLARWPAQIVAEALTATVGAEVTAAAVKTHPGLYAALDDGSGEVRGAALAGERYTDAELAALAAAGDPLLVATTCALAWGLILARKTQGVEAVPEEVKEARRKLDLLRFGVAVFAVPAAEDAGLPKLVTPTAAQRQAAGLFADLPFFPPRGK